MSRLASRGVPPRSAWRARGWCSSVSASPASGRGVPAGPRGGRPGAVGPPPPRGGEPLSAVDAPLRRQLREELGRIIREWGKATVLVTHDLAEAYQLADRIAGYE